MGAEIGHASQIWLILIKLGFQRHAPQILGFLLTHETTVLAPVNESCAWVDFVRAATVIFSNIVSLFAVGSIALLMMFSIIH